MNEENAIRKRLPFRRAVIDQRVPETPGVYAFWCKDVTRCVYVGRSEKLKTRLMQHVKMVSHNEELHMWIESCYNDVQFCYLAKPMAVIDRYELFFWERLRPITNKTRPTSRKTQS